MTSSTCECQNNSAFGQIPETFRLQGGFGLGEFKETCAGNQGKEIKI
jgi:hypothetical protein